eukprot:SAG11_NODE_696_length_7693_cov_9.962339_2_plen_154_part_00
MQYSPMLNACTHARVPCFVVQSAVDRCVLSVVHETWPPASSPPRPPSQLLAVMRVAVLVTFSSTRTTYSEHVFRPPVTGQCICTTLPQDGRAFQPLGVGRTFVTQSLNDKTVGFGACAGGGNHHAYAEMQGEIVRVYLCLSRLLSSLTIGLWD